MARSARRWPWGAIVAVGIASLAVGIAIGSGAFTAKPLTQNANAYTVTFAGVTAFQGSKATVFVGISTGLGGGAYNSTSSPITMGASIAPVYLNATGGTVCGPGGFAEVFSIPTNSSVGTHYLNFTFGLTYGSSSTTHAATVQVDTIGTTAVSTNVNFYLVFSVFPLGGISAFTIIVSQTG